MKLVTAITALDKLGGSYQFKTTLKYTGTVENGVLKGDIYCVGGMDPLFNADDMSAFVESIRKMGVDTIRGHLYADKSMKGVSYDIPPLLASNGCPVFSSHGRFMGVISNNKVNRN